jgi:hypothetical protein
MGAKLGKKGDEELNLICIFKLLLDVVIYETNTTYPFV